MPIKMNTIQEAKPSSGTFNLTKFEYDDASLISENWATDCETEYEDDMSTSSWSSDDDDVYELNDEDQSCAHGMDEYSDTSHQIMKSINPKEFFKYVLNSKGMSPVECPTNSIKNYFLPMTTVNIDSYDTEMSLAIRREDLKTLRRIQKSGRTLQCCNKFHESVVHTVCRRGSIRALKFLVQEGGVSMRLRCESGRTPLHDACWTASPNFDLIKILIEECPEFLYITDNRGYSPLCYVPVEVWGKWCQFLVENHTILLPKSVQMENKI